MKLLWEETAWEDYCYWQTQDKKTLKRINMLIKDIQRNTFSSIGNPEPWLVEQTYRRKKQNCLSRKR